MRLVWGGVAGALSLALAGCNSGGSPTPSPTPTPTPTGTPTPTPTPTDVTFTTSEAGLQYTLENGIQLVANATAIPSAMTDVFRFTPASGGYTYVLRNGSVAPSAEESIVFPPASAKECTRLTLCFGNAFIHQQVDVAPSSYYLSRFIAGSANPVLALGQVSFGVFEESLVDPGGGPRTHVDLRPFAYGIASTGTQIPTTGSVTYNGFVAGQATGNKPAGQTTASNIYQIKGTFQLVANHAAQTATLKLTLQGTATGCTTCPAAINLTYDNVAGTMAAGVVTFTLPGGSGVFFMAGQTAAEIGGSFLLTAADPNEAAVTMIVAGSGAGR